MARHVPLAGKRFSRLRQAEVVPRQIQEVGGILAVVDGEIGIEPDVERLLAQKPRADAVERAGPGQRVGQNVRACAERLLADAPHPRNHFAGRRAARKRHQQDAAGIGAADDQMGDAMRQRAGLARARAGDDQQRPLRAAIPRPAAARR